MHVDRYERMWMWGAGVLAVAFVAVVVVTSVAHAVHPPSHVETIDPTTARQDPRFAQPGVRPRAGGGAEVVMLAQMFSFNPAEVRVQAGQPVTFRVTSPDVSHGFQIVGTNVNTMVLPGYVSQLTVTFPRPGEYLLVCNEYCGLAHHVMQGKVVVEAP
jgi:cytochrome c oxidase subunit 2